MLTIKKEIAEKIKEVFPSLSYKNFQNWRDTSRGNRVLWRNGRFTFQYQNLSYVCFLVYHKQTKEINNFIIEVTDITRSPKLWFDNDRRGLRIEMSLSDSGWNWVALDCEKLNLLLSGFIQ